MSARKGHFHVGYVKTGEGLEVDFLARHYAGKEELIQVCADLSAPETLKRELRALREEFEQDLLCAFDAVAIVEACYRSSRTGAWVDIPKI